MLPMPATTFWSRIKGFNWALREPRVSRKYSTSKPSSRGSVPGFASRASSSSASSRRAREKPVWSRKNNLRSPLRWRTSMSDDRGSSTGGTRSSWPPILSWKTRESPESSSTMRCLARRRAPVARTPSRRRTNSSLEGCSTSAGSRTSAPSITEPTTSPRRSSFMVSTSGSSGMRLLAPPGDAHGTRERDGFLVDGPVQPVEHDRAGVERAHGPLPHPPLTLLVPGVGGDGVHHDAGVLYVHGDVAGKDLQSLVRQPRRPLQTLGEADVDRGHRPLARRPQGPKSKPGVRG